MRWQSIQNNILVENIRDVLYSTTLLSAKIKSVVKNSKPSTLKNKRASEKY